MFSVLLSVYQKEDAAYLKKALESIICQSLLPGEVVLVEDGPLTAALLQVIVEFARELRDRGIVYRPVRLKENRGLGIALQEGLLACSYPLVARMDGDDIACPERFRLQFEYFRADSETCALGGAIGEFVEEGTLLQVKRMPLCHRELYRYGKLRNPLNHMSVMFKKEEILSVGGYKPLPGLEDYYLWSRLLAAGGRIANLPEVLVHARVDRDFAARRGGIAYFSHYRTLRRYQHAIGYTNRREYFLGVLVSALMTLQPRRLRGLTYRWLRKV